MIKLLLFLILLLSACCTEPNNQEVSEKETTAPSQPTYTLIRDNLYQDANGRLYLKSKTMEHFESGDWVDVWISHVYCDPCPADNGEEKDWELKDFVDVPTFHFSKSDSEQGADIYEDAYFTYFHKLMADGGTVTVWEK